MSELIDTGYHAEVTAAIQAEAARILADGTVTAVIGYGRTRRKGGAQPLLITSAADAEKLIFSVACVNNLAVYLTKAKKDIPKSGKVAVMVKSCDLKGLTGLMGESQLKRGDLYLIGLPCCGMLGSVRQPDQPLTTANIAPKCTECDEPIPPGCDFLPVTSPTPLPELEKRYETEIARLEGLSAAERWEYWKEQFSKCIKCYACRQVCPFCYCEQCLCDRNRPQMVEQSPRPAGNAAWHIMRGMHLAGRCVGCAECERACPMDIPLNLLNRKMARELKELFGSEAGFNVRDAGPLNSYRDDDDQSFIR